MLFGNTLEMTHDQTTSIMASKFHLFRESRPANRSVHWIKVGNQVGLLFPFQNFDTALQNTIASYYLSTEFIVSSTRHLRYPP